ncbi:MAG: xanthine dehydrogenase family protein subunit M [Gammaproteobacteria bacterium]|nr:MAG: xanthine dehydrogenase family protein subunit M [Gammaproteobacteria bacterium]
MYNFTYHRPATLAEAIETLGATEDGQLLAGGMTLLPTLKQRLAQPSDLIDLGSITELQGVKREKTAVVIGAMTPHADVAAADVVAEAIPALARLAGTIGDPQVRNRGTIGGSIANADPAADYLAAVVGLGATVHTNERAIAADDFFTGMFETALGDNELITAVSFPVPKRAAYAKFPNPASRYAVVGVFVSQGNDGVRVAVTGAGPSVFRVTAMEQALSGKFSADALDGISIPADDLNSDLHASAEYRAHLVSVMAKRAVAAAG